MGEMVRGIRRILGLTVTLRNLGELLIGTLIFYGCEAAFDLLLIGPTTRVSIPGRVLFLAFAVVPPILLCLSTIWLYKRSRRRPYTVWPEVNLVVGTLIFAPIYLEFASRIIYRPRPLDFAEILQDLVWLYSMFPLTAFSIMVYTFGIAPLILSTIATTLIGWLVRRGSSPGLTGRLPDPTEFQDPSRIPPVVA